jgi:hypothetical protein
VSTQEPPHLSEEELAALEAELERITVDDVVLQTIVSLVNLGARKAGLGAPPGAGPAADWEQVRVAIEATRALLAVVESRHADKLGPVRDAVAQLQLAYAQKAARPAAPGETAPGQPGEGTQEDAEGPGPAQSSGRLWVPGQ